MEGQLKEREREIVSSTRCNSFRRTRGIIIAILIRCALFSHPQAFLLHDSATICSSGSPCLWPPLVADVFPLAQDAASSPLHPKPLHSSHRRPERPSSCISSPKLPPCGHQFCRLPARVAPCRRRSIPGTSRRHCHPGHSLAATLLYALLQISKLGGCWSRAPSLADTWSSLSISGATGSGGASLKQNWAVARPLLLQNSGPTPSFAAK